MASRSGLDLHRKGRELGIPFWPHSCPRLPQCSALLQPHLPHFSPSNTPRRVPPQGLCTGALTRMFAPSFCGVNATSTHSPESSSKCTRWVKSLIAPLTIAVTTQGIQVYVSQGDYLLSACLPLPHTVNLLKVSP